MDSGSPWRRNRYSARHSSSINVAAPLRKLYAAACDGLALELTSRAMAAPEGEVEAATATARAAIARALAVNPGNAAILEAETRIEMREGSAARARAEEAQLEEEAVRAQRGALSSAPMTHSVGERVVLVGLSRADLNGQLATVVAVTDPRDPERAQVRLDSTDTTVKIKRTNLRASPRERATGEDLAEQRDVPLPRAIVEAGEAMAVYHTCAVLCGGGECGFELLETGDGRGVLRISLSGPAGSLSPAEGHLVLDDAATIARDVFEARLIMLTQPPLPQSPPLRPAALASSAPPPPPEPPPTRATDEELAGPDEMGDGPELSCLVCSGRMLCFFFIIAASSSLDFRSPRVRSPVSLRLTPGCCCCCCICVAFSSRCECICMMVAALPRSGLARGQRAPRQG